MVTTNPCSTDPSKATWDDDRMTSGNTAFKSKVDKPFFIDSVMMPRLENKKPNANRIRL